ncbi:DUF1877 family protein [Actinoplanes sp. NPDC048796]|uniref:DUF1877 family protein n=1 Tax=unclassified Actinoplanes TaxID=2626549 RepID=UPI0033E4E7C8
MSVLGEFRRMSPALLEEIRADPANAWNRVGALDDMLDLDRAWERLADLMDRSGFPLNPITGGVPFPDERHDFGSSLTAKQVKAAAEHLSVTPFGALEVHLRPLLETEEPHGGHVDERRARAIRDRLALAYFLLVGFYRTAAAEGQATVFWAA